MLTQLDTHKITNFLQKTYLRDTEVQFIQVYGRSLTCYLVKPI